MIYMDLMRGQIQYQTAEQKKKKKKKDFELRLASITTFVPFYFYYNICRTMEGMLASVNKS